MNAALVKTAGSSDYLNYKLAMLGAMGVASVAGLAYQIKLLRELRGLRKQDAKGTARYVRSADLPGKIHTRSIPGLNNAYYRPKEDHWVENRVTRMLGGKPSRQEVASEVVGSMAFDPKFKKPAVVAHELGHAQIGNLPWYALSRLNQNYGRAASGIAGSLAALVSPILGSATAEATERALEDSASVPQFLKNTGVRRGLGIAAGGLLGATVGGVAGLPVLINEWQASDRARKMLNADPRLNAKERARSDQFLNSAFNTYLRGATLFPGVGGALGGAMLRL